jgi:hypothetical protein
MEELQEFPQNLKNYITNIKFAVEIEANSVLVSWDILVIRKGNGLIRHMVYRRLTHMDLCLHIKSHHPSKTCSYGCPRSKTMCDTEGLRMRKSRI